MDNFESLGLSKQLLKAVTAMGFEKPSEIQEQAIPQLIEGTKDFIGLAQTGTGKTAAFGLPLLQLVDPKSSHTQGLVLAPTRELGKQIAEQLQQFSKYQDRTNILCVYGGASIINQIKDLKKPQHIIIATPGRLIDLIGRRAISLEHIRYIVLDEADEMLNMGFKEDIDRILSYTPDTKKTWLFSATMPKEMQHIVSKYMDKPNEARINPKQEVNVNISHQFAVVQNSHKAEALRRFLDIADEMRCVIFCRTKRGTQNLADFLMQNDYKADALHGDLSQNLRDRVMSKFRNDEIQVLVATDVAARGIDVDDLTHVFHYSLPDDSAYYTHRAGRTARAGKKGISLAFITSKEAYRINKLKKQLNIPFEHVLIPQAKDIVKARVEEWLTDLIKGSATISVDPRLLTEVQIALKDISKEELIEKMLAKKLKFFNKGSNVDLNDHKKIREDSSGRSGDRRNSSKRSNSHGGRKKKYGGPGGKSKYGNKGQRNKRYKK